MSDVIERNWAYDGPHTTDTLTSAAEAISALARYMANALWSVKPTGPELYQVLSSLDSTMRRLGDVVDHLGDAAHWLATDPTLYDDRPDVLGDDTAELLAAWLRQVQIALATARREIERAAGIASHLGHRAVTR